MNDSLKIWLNGEIVPWEAAQVPVLSHGLSRGSAIFEAFGTHVVDNRVVTFRMDKHLERMARTLEILEMKAGFSFDQISAAVADVCEANRIKRGMVKIMGYWSEEAIINLVLDSALDIAVFTVPEAPELHLDDDTPRKVCFSKWNKPDPHAIPVMAKACANYLPGYLVLKDAKQRGFDLGITVNADGHLAEGSIESVFVVKNNVIKTPPLGNILASVSRDSILAAGRANGLDVQEALLTKEDVYTADELFTCHTGVKVKPVCRFEGRDLPAPGPVTAKLSEILKAIVATGGEPGGFQSWFQNMYTL